MAPMFDDYFRYLEPETDLDLRISGWRRFIDKRKEKSTNLQVERLTYLSAVQAETNNLVANSSTDPEQIFVIATQNFKYLNEYGIVPENFKNQVDRENVVILRNKLLNIIETCKSLMSLDQLDKSEKCINAFLMQKSIELINYYLSAYREYEQNKTRWDRIIRRHKQVILIRWFVLGIISAVILIRTSSISIQLGIWHSIDFLNFGLFIGLVSYGIFILITDPFMPKEYSYIKERYKYVKSEGNIEDVQFWQAVKDRYGGLPTDEQLEESWNEQLKIIQTVFEDFRYGDSIDPD